MSIGILEDKIAADPVTATIILIIFALLHWNQINNFKFVVCKPERRMKT